MMADKQSETKPDPRLDTIGQALIELYHCAQVGPQWFTNNRRGQMDHARAWVDRARTAITEVDSALSQAERTGYLAAVTALRELADHLRDPETAEVVRMLATTLEEMKP